MSLHFFRVTGSSSGRWISRVVWRDDWHSLSVTMCFSPVLSRIHLMVVQNLRFGGRSESEWGLQILTDQTDCWPLASLEFLLPLRNLLCIFLFRVCFRKKKQLDERPNTLWCELHCQEKSKMTLGVIQDDCVLIEKRNKKSSSSQKKKHQLFFSSISMTVTTPHRTKDPYFLSVFDLLRFWS